MMKMLKKVAKNARKTKEQKLQDRIDELLSKIEENHITIGQWQNKLYALQARFDAYKLAQVSSMETFRDFYMRERGDFLKYNEVWQKHIEELNQRTLTLEQRIWDLENEKSVEN
jgi:polyhydroxyalkanoate synthesis regulator phasin